MDPRVKALRYIGSESVHRFAQALKNDLLIEIGSAWFNDIISGEADVA